MAEPWTARQGSTVAYDVKLRDSGGAVLVNTYDGSETFSLVVWAGDDQQPASMPGSTAAWLGDAPQNGVVKVTLHGDDLAGLAPGAHRVLLRLTTGGRTYDAFETKLEVYPGPGTGEALPTGGLTYDRLLRHCPSLRQFVLADSAQRADFSEQMNSAWLWLRSTLLARAEAKLRWYGAGNFLPADGDPLIPDDFAWGETGVLARVEEIGTALDDGGLDLADGEALRVLACYAAAEILEPRPGPTKEGETNWQRLGVQFRAKSRMALAGYVARVDVGDADDRLLILRP